MTGKPRLFTVLTLCLGAIVHLVFSIPLFTPHQSPGDFYAAAFYPHWSVIYFFGAQVFHAQAVNTSEIWWNVVVTCPVSLCYGAAATFAFVGAAKLFNNITKRKTPHPKPKSRS